MKTIESLIEKIHEAVGEINQRDLGIAFSGGVDSSILAATCKAQGRNVTLITVGFLSKNDIEASIEAARDLNLNVISGTVDLEELEEGIRHVLRVISPGRIVLIENSVCFYYVFKIASQHGIGTVLSANGMDELFCGYDLYRRCADDEEEAMRLMRRLVETARRDKEEIDKVASLWNVKYECPFLSEGFVESAMRIPLRYKIRGKDDALRKHILREAAMRIGVPEGAAMRRKKAFQYSSGVHKAIARLARLKGYTKSLSKALGYSGPIEAYLKTLLLEGNNHQTGH